MSLSIEFSRCTRSLLTAKFEYLIISMQAYNFPLFNSDAYFDYDNLSEDELYYIKNADNSSSIAKKIKNQDE